MEYVVAILIIAGTIASLIKLYQLVKPHIPQSVFWEGRGTYDHEVVTTHECQPALFRIAGGSRREGMTKHVVATLHLDDSNKQDNQAVRVSVRWQTMGYMSPKDARAYRQRVREAGYERARGKCAAIIVGGKKKGIDSKAHFGILLDLPTSSALTRRTSGKKS